MKSKIAYYHAEVPLQAREQRQRSWSKGDVKVRMYVRMYVCVCVCVCVLTKNPIDE